MIQRIIGVAVGALVTIGVLWWNHVDTTLAATAAILGAIAAFFWPMVIGLFLVRRNRSQARRRDPGRGGRQMAAQQNQH